MKNKIHFLLSVCIAVAVLTGCSSDDSSSGPDTFGYDIHIEYPESYGGGVVANASVVLKNLSTNIETSMTTDEDGVAAFTEIAPGNYSVTVSRTLSATEAEVLTGIGAEVFLNATLSQLQILADGATTIQLEGSAVGDWVIKEFYYSGAPDSYYFYDGFIEIYNNSTDVQYADGLLFGTTKSASSSSTSFYGFITEGYEDAFLAYVMQIPGNGTDYPVEPGASVVIAIDGIDHKDDPNGNANSPVNLGPDVADFEVYFYANPNTPDTDSPDVPNVEIIYSYSTTVFDYLPGVFGSGLVIFRHDNPGELERLTEPGSTSSREFVRVPKAYVVDALDAVANSSVTPELKRLPTNLDAGMNTVGGSYTGTSLRRKVKQEIGGRKVLLDTNNSATDFEVNNSPSPKGW
ncbi:Carboxypeptidase regulatory-like domain-containing protein [Sinomicrobium oceani]|uniref:Carboxypeptidase regulatory-like domain-containing protein n=1 Tax=Sinomicrobium oceani TaxID=1150368 RepID=A0A1K1RJ10_9FLAO|nr:DUF4876 domain-containing protein [Sinomicrobium oceani]SFW71787.1 Carboxypeptidase regulatory-like domain-containing protein [Sinomicrobium oceani]